jgi:hypothetical protein
VALSTIRLAAVLRMQRTAALGFLTLAHKLINLANNINSHIGFLGRCFSVDAHDNRFTYVGHTSFFGFSF